jgi:hypothetical protein
VNLGHRAKLTLTLSALLGQNVAFKGLLVLDAIGSFFETLCRTADSFNLWHYSSPRIRLLIGHKPNNKNPHTVQKTVRFAG